MDSEQYGGLDRQGFQGAAAEPPELTSALSEAKLLRVHALTSALSEAKLLRVHASDHALLLVCLCIGREEREKPTVSGSVKELQALRAAYLWFD